MKTTLLFSQEVMKFTDNKEKKHVKSHHIGFKESRIWWTYSLNLRTIVSVFHSVCASHFYSFVIIKLYRLKIFSMISLSWEINSQPRTNLDCIISTNSTIDNNFYYYNSNNYSVSCSLLFNSTSVSKASSLVIGSYKSNQICTFSQATFTITT